MKCYPSRVALKTYKSILIRLKRFKRLKTVLKHIRRLKNFIPKKNFYLTISCKMQVSGLFPDPVDSEYRNARIPWTRTAFQVQQMMAP